MMAAYAWELPSNSGREVARWTVVDVLKHEAEPVFVCDIELAGRYFRHEEGLDAADCGDLGAFALQMPGMRLRMSDLRRLADHLNEWRALPLATLRETPLDASFGAGGMFDQYLELRFGQRDDTISDGHQTATLAHNVGRLKGELSYTVDQSCVGILVDGIEAALRGAS